MKKTQMKYFRQEDVIHLMLNQGQEAASVELSPNITAELDASGALIGIEIIEASAFIRDMIMETAQAKLLTLPMPEKVMVVSG